MPILPPIPLSSAWAALAHVAVASVLVVPVLGGWVGPLAVRLTKGKTSEYRPFHNS